MGIFAEYKKKDYTPAPEGLWQAVCCDVVDRGMQKTPWGTSHKVVLYWQLEDIDPKTKKRFLATKNYTLSLHEKANLRRDLESWRGRKFKEDELKKFDLEKLIGANCQLSIAHNIKDEGETYANIQAIVPINGKQVKLGISKDFVRKVDRDKSTNGGGEWNPDAEEPVDDSYSPF